MTTYEDAIANLMNWVFGALDQAVKKPSVPSLEIDEQDEPREIRCAGCCGKLSMRDLDRVEHSDDEPRCKACRDYDAEFDSIYGGARRL